MDTLRSVVLRVLAHQPVPAVGSISSKLRGHMSRAMQEACKSRGWKRPVTLVEDVRVPRGGNHRSMRVSVFPPGQPHYAYLVHCAAGEVRVVPDTDAAVAESVIEDVLES